MTFEEAVQKAVEVIQAYQEERFVDREIDLDELWYLDIWVDQGIYCVLLRRDDPCWLFNLSDQF